MSQKHISPKHSWVVIKKYISSMHQIYGPLAIPLNLLDLPGAHTVLISMIRSLLQAMSNVPLDTRSTILNTESHPAVSSYRIHIWTLLYIQPLLAKRPCRIIPQQYTIKYTKYKIGKFLNLTPIKYTILFYTIPIKLDAESQYTEHIVLLAIKPIGHKVSQTGLTVRIYWTQNPIKLVIPSYPTSRSHYKHCITQSVILDMPSYLFG